MVPDVKVEIPLTRGHYGGITDTVGNLLNHSKIPLGYYFGIDVEIDDCGQLRFRPELIKVYLSDTSVITQWACFKNSGTFYTINSVSGQINYWNGSQWVIVTGTPTYSGANINVTHYSNSSDYVTRAIISAAGGTPYSVSGTNATLVHASALGLAEADEGRLFFGDKGIVRYSWRGNMAQGYDAEGDGEMFPLASAADTIVGLMSIAGSLYIIQSNSASEKTFIWKKIQTYKDEEELIDQTSFMQVFGTLNGVVDGFDGISALGGSLILWIKSVGLGIMNEAGISIVSEPINSQLTSSIGSKRIISVSEKRKRILVSSLSYSKTMVYDYLNQTWSMWDVQVTGKGFGQTGGMFCIAGVQSPTSIGPYYSTVVSGLTGYVWTPAMNLGFPGKEKFLKKILLTARGITSLDIYTRLKPSVDFTLLKTISNPETEIILEGNERFDEVYIKLTGNTLFLVKDMTLIIDVGENIKL